MVAGHTLFLFHLLLPWLPFRTAQRSDNLSYDANWCYDGRAFGPIHTRHTNQTFNLSLPFCHASRTLQGDASQFQPIQAKLQDCHDGGGLQIMVFGGSVSCGRNIGSHPERLCQHIPQKMQKNVECKTEVWAHYVEQGLNYLYPCPVPHRVNNRCISASGTNLFMGMIGKLRAENGSQSLLHADIIMVEMSNNDIWHLTKGPQDRKGSVAILKETEVLVRQLLLLPGSPVIMYLHMAWRNLYSPPYHFDTSDLHRHILEWYNVPQISVMAAFHPLAHPVHHDWLLKYYFADPYGHVTGPGHKLTAAIVMFNIQRDMKMSIHHPWFHPLERQKELPPPISGVDPKTLESFEALAIGSSQFFIDLRDFNASAQYVITNATLGFTFYSDVPTKPGLIATEVGARVVLNCTAGVAAMSVGRQYITKVGHLVSYEHMGCAKVSAIAFNQQTNWSTLASTTIDGAIAEKYSVYRQASFTWIQGNFTTASDGIGISVEVVNCVPPRRENKVKLLDLSLF